ncbi:MAG: DUF4190 domain-containing protein [Actinomycetota bacterium]|nr:DUF4190 domain-containing protein [Actinomycetota bacterium]
MTDDRPAPPPGDPAPRTQGSYQQPSYGQDAGYGQPPKQTNGVAIGALVVGLLSVPLAIFVIGGLLGLIAVILGFVGVSKSKSLRGAGKGMAITGIVSGALGLILAVLVVAGVATLFSNPQLQQELQRQRELQS